MADIHYLEDKMRSLRLNGMLDTLELRLSQARKDGLGFIQFFELLLEDEVQHQANKRLGQFDFNFNPKVPARYVRDLATCHL